ncbi:MAG: 1-acyl-sn-glycerol-3-phosphate acyltransferase [Planctomycetes bacterium]|nr:1-acyl-sn-glycerol-3-phosphate acyltransferase [Planctomycetota bacterium]
MLKPPLQPVSRPPVQRWVYSASRVLVRLASVVAFGMRIEGRDRIPSQGPVLVCANHQSHFDPLLIGLCSDRPMNFVARDSLFRIPVLKQVMEFYDAIPLDREGNGLAGLKETLRRLKRGEMVLIFPEGSRTHDGEVSPLKAGFLTLARRAEAAVLPVAVDGAFDALPRHRWLPRPARVCVHIGEPILPGDASALDDAAFLAEVERRIRASHGEARRLRFQSSK